MTKKATESLHKAMLERLAARKGEPKKPEEKRRALIPTKPIRGRVVGRAQVLQSRKDLLFWIFDLKTDAAILCYMEPDQRDWLDGLLDKIVEVYGAVTRDPLTGRPKYVHDITKIVEIEPLAPGALKALSGYLGGKLQAKNGAH